MRFDIMPADAALGGHNRVTHLRMGAGTSLRTISTSWREGEVLLLNAAAGDVDVIDADAEAVTINHYVAAVSSEGALIAAGLDAAIPATPDIMVPCYPLLGPDAGTFICANIVTNSDTQLTAAQRTAILVGDAVGFWRHDTDAIATSQPVFGVNGRFSVDTNGTGLRILAKLDANGRDCDGPGGSNTVAFFIVGE